MWRVVRGDPRVVRVRVRFRVRVRVRVRRNLLLGGAAARSALEPLDDQVLLGGQRVEPSLDRVAQEDHRLAQRVVPVGVEVRRLEDARAPGRCRGDVGDEADRECRGDMGRYVGEK